MGRGEDKGSADGQRREEVVNVSVDGCGNDRVTAEITCW